MPLADLLADFEARTGARIVFDRADLPDRPWYDVMEPIPEAERAHSVEIALEQARIYPPGFLAEAGVQTVGLFAGLASKTDDGYHTWDEDLGGYAFFGMTDGDAFVAAHYNDRQLPLTFNHELFHAADAVNGSSADDARFLRAIDGTEPYAAPALADSDLASLRKMSGGEIILEDAVGAYSGKNRGEDQAETARHMMAHLPAALVQMHDHPELAGSQRMLHVVAELGAVPGGPTFERFVDVALGRADARETLASLRGQIRPVREFVVYGEEDADGVNWTLREQISQYGDAAATLANTPAELDGLALLADYHAYIAETWSVTPGTRNVFEDARAEMIGALPPTQSPLASALAAASLEDLAAVMDPDAPVQPSMLIGALAARGVAVNPYVANVDAELTDPDVIAAIRSVQPATVRLSTGGGAASGVNLSPAGQILTAAHVPDALGAEVTVRFPDGSAFVATCTKIDAKHDLALLTIDGAADLPYARIASAAPAVGEGVYIVGQPGKNSPDGEPTGYQPWTVSAGEIRAFADDPLGDQGMGGVSHDAWTYWGHSGSPLFDEQGRIVAIHNSWDSRTAMRHAVTWESIRAFLQD